MIYIKKTKGTKKCVIKEIVNLEIMKNVQKHLKLKMKFRKLLRKEQN